MDKLQLGFINYMNTVPFLFGLRKTNIINGIDLHQGNPAYIFQKLANHQVDIGIIPVGALLTLPKYFTHTEYCIATDGEVASVCIFSKSPIEKITTIFLDYQSRSSVLLAKIICKFIWKKEIIFLPTQQDNFFDNIEAQEAALIIGDRALKARSQFEYIYDLGILWKTLTSLPFVFAVWGSLFPINSYWEQLLNEAFKYGTTHIEEIIQEYTFIEYPMDIYFKKNIQYTLDNEKRKAIEVYQQYIQKL
ncbi:MAG: menaquinone biosynthetic enzyme MqnA/MqnD family protein [Chitinophagaceae bacterium]